ncbi:hypothetical protein TNCV_707821 [Trichonephila clavipes]|nr:hypothetical protein TNCV_707821 [Trichonephila clavipes]
MLSNPTPRSSSRSTCPLSSSSFHGPLPYNNLGQVAATDGSSIVTTLTSITENNLRNRGRRKNGASELTSAENLAYTKKRIVKRGRREGVGAKCRTSVSKHNAACIRLVCGTNYYDENQGQEWVPYVVVLVHPGFMKNVSS